MAKGVGFNRNVRLDWLNAAAGIYAEGANTAEARARLEAIVGQDIASAENRRKAVDILVNIWGKATAPREALRASAIALFQASSTGSDRICLHYGMALGYYSFFRETAAAIGALCRYEAAVTPAMIKQRLYSDRGQLGSLEKAVERVMFSMRNWGILAEVRRYAYSPASPISTTSEDLQCWLLACALWAHPAEEIPFTDLVRLPELFPFRFAVGVDNLRGQPWFGVQRQGIGWDMLRYIGFAEKRTP